MDRKASREMEEPDIDVTIKEIRERMARESEPQTNDPGEGVPNQNPGDGTQIHW